MKMFGILKTVLYIANGAAKRNVIRSFRSCKHNNVSQQTFITQRHCIPKLSNSIAPMSSFIPHRTISVSAVVCSGLDDAKLKTSMEKLTDKFTEARELLEDARESKDTVYFSEDMSNAQEAVKQTLEDYQSLLDQISETQKQQVTRTIGLRMEELKAQISAMEEELKEE